MAMPVEGLMLLLLIVVGLVGLDLFLWFKVRLGRHRSDLTQDHFRD